MTTLEDLYALYRGDGRVAGLRSGARQFVGGVGPAPADLMLIGEAPGADEDALGAPFVGHAGGMLDTLMAHADIDRADVFITNAVKYRPPNNRTPRPFEVGASLECLYGEIGIVSPKVVVTLGATALFALLPGLTLTSVNGTWLSWNDVMVMPTWHPAAALRVPAKEPLIVKALVAAKEELARCAKS